MSTVSSVSTRDAISGRAAEDSTTAIRLPQKTLGQDEFMRLLAVQFQMQDPMKPMADTAFIAQSAQFAALEQSTQLGKHVAELRAEQQRATANSYLGHQVMLDAGGGEILAGTVSAVLTQDGEPRLVVGERDFPVTAVLRTERLATAATSLPNTPA